MANRRNPYTTRGDKVIDFLIGFFGCVLVNGLLLLIGQIIPGSGRCLGYLGLMINITGLVVLAATRTWMAVGALAVFALALLLVLIAAVYVFVYCMNYSY